MKLRWLLLVPPVAAAAFLLGEALLWGHHFHLVKALSLLGGLMAAFTFKRGEYLRRTWMFISGCMFLLLLRDTTYLPFIEEFDLPWALLRGSLVVLANGSGVIGAWMLARAWRVAGLQLPGTSRQRRGVLLVTIALALGSTGPSVVIHFEKLMQGSMTALSGVASGLGDIVSFSLIAPLLLTAIALRGGLLVWPWALFTSSQIAWLCYDATHVLGPLFGTAGCTVFTISAVFRCLACTFWFTAGLAQRMVVKEIRSS